LNSPVLTSSQQLLLVIASAWDSRAAHLQRFERANPDGDWQPVGALIAVSLGKSGLAWGRGRHQQVADRGPEKREGDGCAPAGVFAITALFGYDAPDQACADAAKLSYLQASADLKAIDDPASRYYNQIVDQAFIAQPDWASCEDMLRDDQRYALGAVVAHNSEAPLPGAGSCIFLHVWEKEGAPTAGCTAMSLADMRVIAGWLDRAAEPLLVQLPLAEYARLQGVWGLPEFSD
jgi:L,D-peptidoglycan transpeptidase YkuD (ErfK/YbiS/YcfS/YnhG family)